MIDSTIKYLIEENIFSDIYIKKQEIDIDTEKSEETHIFYTIGSIDENSEADGNTIEEALVKFILPVFKKREEAR